MRHRPACVLATFLSIGLGCSSQRPAQIESAPVESSQIHGIAHDESDASIVAEVKRLVHELDDRSERIYKLASSSGSLDDAIRKFRERVHDLHDRFEKGIVGQEILHAEIEVLRDQAGRILKGWSETPATDVRDEMEVVVQILSRLRDTLHPQ